MPIRSMIPSRSACIANRYEPMLQKKMVPMNHKILDNLVKSLVDQYRDQQMLGLADASKKLRDFPGVKTMLDNLKRQITSQKKE